MILSEDEIIFPFIAETTRKPRVTRKPASSFSVDTPLFDVTAHSAKHLRQFKFSSLGLIPSLFSSEAFVSKVRICLSLLFVVAEPLMIVSPVACGSIFTAVYTWSCCWSMFCVAVDVGVVVFVCIAIVTVTTAYSVSV